MVLLGAQAPREVCGYQEESPGGFAVIVPYSLPWFGRRLGMGSRAGFSYVIWAGGLTLLSGLCPRPPGEVCRRAGAEVERKPCALSRGSLDNVSTSYSPHWGCGLEQVHVSEPVSSFCILRIKTMTTQD